MFLIWKQLINTNLTLVSSKQTNYINLRYIICTIDMVQRFFSKQPKHEQGTY